MKKITPKEIIIPTVSLFIICLVVACALSITNALTKDQIDENEALTKEMSMMTVCDNAVTFEELIPDVAYKGIDGNGNAAGYAISTSANGYGGQVMVMTGISTDGKILNIDVYDNDDETPGLGKNTSASSFTDQFSGLDAAGDLIVNKDYDGTGQEVDAVTSATISSRAVVKAVNEACEIYKEISAGGED